VRSSPGSSRTRITRTAAPPASEQPGRGVALIDRAVGPYGWIMTINFCGRGVTSAALVVAILTTGPPTARRTVGSALRGVAGFCSAFIAFFAIDVRSREGIAPSTTHGLVHIVGASSGFVFALAPFWALSFWAPARSRATSAFLLVASTGLLALAASIAAFPEEPAWPNASAWWASWAGCW